MKRAASRKFKPLSYFLILTLLITSMTSANAATLFSSDYISCSSYGHGNLRVEDIPLTISAPASVTSIVLRLGSNSGEASSQIRIFADSSDNPGTLIGTFTFSSVSGLYATYVGTASLISAGKYWIRFSTTASFTPCYSNSPSFVGSLSGWSIGRMRESVDSGSTFTTRIDNISFLFVLKGPDGISLSATSYVAGRLTAALRTPFTISATLGVNGSDGKATFFANGKRIAGCINKQSSGLSVTCSWKPTVRGSVALTAKLTPTDTSYLSSTSAPLNVVVANRASTR